MAAIDAVMSEDRARAIVEKYKARAVEGQGVAATAPLWLGELQSDIANGINAAIAEVLGRTVEVTDGLADASLAEDEPVRRTRNTTHMPATGSHKRG